MYGVSKATFVILVAVAHGLSLGMCAWGIFGFISRASEANWGTAWGVQSNHYRGKCADTRCCINGEESESDRVGCNSGQRQPSLTGSLSYLPSMQHSHWVLLCDIGSRDVSWPTD